MTFALIKDDLNIKWSQQEMLYIVISVIKQLVSLDEENKYIPNLVTKNIILTNEDEIKVIDFSDIAIESKFDKSVVSI